MGQAPCEPPDRIFLLSERICCWRACGTGGNGEPSLEASNLLSSSERMFVEALAPALKLAAMAPSFFKPLNCQL